ncbi:MAG TPA: hypothetical protein PKG74_00010 [Candidatus Colwellbacteria bacterium]|jgi:hypothetical protein|nr:hypothetical protein [Candidatus Colwellbacteria bacterium]
MKKNILFSLLTLAMVLAPSAHASNSATVAATVLLENVSVSVSDGTVDYGILALNSSNCTTTLTDTQTVTNEGNVNINILIRGQDSVNWTLSGSADTDKYVHRFCNASVNDCDTPPTDYTALTLNNQTLGSALPPSDTIDLDLNLTTPTASTFFIQQDVDVIITAIAS